MIGTLNAHTGGDLPIKKTVHVTSLAFTLSTGGQMLGVGGTIMFLSVNSWTEEEYVQTAKKCQLLMFLNKHDRLRQVFAADAHKVVEDDGTDSDDVMETSDADDVEDHEADNVDTLIRIDSNEAETTTFDVDSNESTKAIISAEVAWEIVQMRIQP